MAQKTIWRKPGTRVVIFPLEISPGPIIGQIDSRTLWVATSFCLAPEINRSDPPILFVRSWTCFFNFGVVFFQRCINTSIFIHPKKSRPKKEASHTCGCCDVQNLPPPHQTNQTRHFFGLIKNRVEWKPTFPFRGLWSSGSFQSKWSNAWSHGHSPRTRPEHAMVWVRWLKGWRVGDGRRGWEIKEKTLGGWRLLVILVHGIRSDVFFTWLLLVDDSWILVVWCCIYPKMDGL